MPPRDAGVDLAGAPIWLTVDQAAAYLQVGPKVIYRAAAAKSDSLRLRSVRVGGRRELRTTRDWLDAFMLVLEKAPAPPRRVKKVAA